MYSQHYLPIGLAFGLVLSTFGSDVAAQQFGRSGANYRTTQVERVARTRWQPTRKPTAAAADPQLRQVAHQESARGRVRLAQASDELPAPQPLPQSDQAAPSQVPLVDLGTEGYEVPMHGERSVLQGSPVQSHRPMDGEIIYDSQPYTGEIFEGEYAETVGCDSMGCSCGSVGCDGGCDSIGSCVGGDCGSCNACAASAWRPCMTLCLPQDGWASFEYLNWTQRGMNLPPLVTRGDAGTVRANAGVLGLNSTDILFGGERVLDDGIDGGRLQFGVWLDRRHQWGLGAEYFELSEESVSFSQGSTGNPILARPFFNILTGREDAELVAFPNVLTGEVSAQATSQLVGGGVNLRHQTNCYSGCGHDWMCGGCSAVHSQTHMLFGYRYLQLDELVSVTEDLISTDTANPGAFLLNDRFATRNQFNGFDIGLLYNRRRGVWSLDCLAKLAIGNTHQEVDIRGTTRVSGGAPQAGGLLAQTSNIGRYERDEFTILPELGATAGYYLTPNFKLKAGYTMIFWSNVVRPGDQIDLDINPNFLPPPAVPFTGANRPGFQFVDSNYYAHGVNLGAELTW